MSTIISDLKYDEINKKNLDDLSKDELIDYYNYFVRKSMKMMDEVSKQKDLLEKIRSTIINKCGDIIESSGNNSDEEDTKTITNILIQPNENNSDDEIDEKIKTTNNKQNIDKVPKKVTKKTKNIVITDDEHKQKEEPKKKYPKK